MKIRFQADADLNLAIVLALRRREPGLDFQTAVEADLEGVADPEVLARAAAEGRVLVTHDLRTMPQHFADFIQGNESSGVLVVSQKRPVALAVEDLLMIWALTEPEEWRNRIFCLPL